MEKIKNNFNELSKKEFVQVIKQIGQDWKQQDTK